VRELKFRLSALEKQMDVRFDAVNERFRSMDVKFRGIDERLQSMDQKNDARIHALLSAISESKAQTELSTFRLYSALSERVAVLEAQRS
jgi:hypothetical protein